MAPAISVIYIAMNKRYMCLAVVQRDEMQGVMEKLSKTDMCGAIKERMNHSAIHLGLW